MHRRLGLHVVNGIEPAAQRLQVFVTPIERMRLLVDPEGSHHRGVPLLLRGLLLVDRSFSVRVAGGDREPSPGLRKHGQDSILASELMRFRMVL